MKYPRRNSTESYPMWGLVIFNKLMRNLLQIDTDHSDTIDFNEFVKIMTWTVNYANKDWNLYCNVVLTECDWHDQITEWYHKVEYSADRLSLSSICRCGAAADCSPGVSWSTDYLPNSQRRPTGGGGEEEKVGVRMSEDGWFESSVRF